MCHGLHEGFWPFANFHQDAPVTWDNSDRHLIGINLKFALNQCDLEIEAGCFSAAFGPDLLPGMYSMPIGIVTKPHSSNFHLVTDHSAGKHMLNSFITKEDGLIRLDSLQDFGTML